MTEAVCHELLLQAEKLLDARELEAAWRSFNAAEAAGTGPDRCAAGRWMTAMLQGQFEAAWRESDRIRRLGVADPHRFWQGEDFTGKRVMLRCLHGFGDAVQMLRYAALIRARAASLTLEVPPRLLELAPMFDGVDDVITWGEHGPAVQPAWDVQMEINELPYIFRTRAEDLPLASRYLRLPRDSSTSVIAREPDSLRVGVVWASGEWNPARSVSLDGLKRLFETPHCEFWNLQGGTSRAEWSSLVPGKHLHDAEESASSIVQLARVIEQVDLVITADTLAAHLAGALGTPAWVMLEYAADWRWQHLRTDSPWYACLRLFRQRTPGDWGSVVSAVQRELSALAAAQNEPRLVA